MLVQKLNQLKEKSGLSNQEIADKSGVGFRTVQRIFSGETENPSFSDITEIVLALGGSVDAILGIEHPHEETSDQVIALYERSLARKNKYINMLIVLCVGMVAIFIALLIFDMLHGNIGYFRY